VTTLVSVILLSPSVSATARDMSVFSSVGVGNHTSFNYLRWYWRPHEMGFDPVFDSTDLLGNVVLWYRRPRRT